MVLIERGEEPEVLRCYTVRCECICARRKRLVKAKIVLLCCSREEVDLTVDIGERAGKQVDYSPTEGGRFVTNEIVWQCYPRDQAGDEANIGLCV